MDELSGGRQGFWWRFPAALGLALVASLVGVVGLTLCQLSGACWRRAARLLTRLAVRRQMDEAVRAVLAAHEDALRRGNVRPH